VVGIVERNDEQVGLVHYVDATTSNTTFTNGSPFTGWTMDNTAGNGGNVITAQSGGAPQAEASAFDGPVTLTGGGGFLYQAYMGRVNVLAGAPVDVFIDDFATAGAANRAWYDGLGYALVTAVIPPLAGDFNGDHVVDAVDYVLWREGFGTIYDQDDYDDWRANFGATAMGSGHSANTSVAAPEPATALGLLLSGAIVLSCIRRRLLPATVATANYGSAKSAWRK
jgi:hypothetical protein